MHIGLIGGIGPAATEFYYRGLIERHAAAGTQLDLTIAHADVGGMGRNLASGDAAKQAAIFLGLVKRLAAAGAEAAAITSMGGHFCVRELTAVSPIPILNAIPEIDAAIRVRQLKTIGIIGTSLVMRTGLYGGITAARVVVPDGEALEEVHQNYVAMAGVGRVSEAQRRVFFANGERLCREQGAEAVFLGGTDLCLAFAGRECGFPVLDSTAIHVEAIYRASIGKA